LLLLPFTLLPVPAPSIPRAVADEPSFTLAYAPEVPSTPAVEAIESAVRPPEWRDWITPEIATGMLALVPEVTQPPVPAVMSAALRQYRKVRHVSPTEQWCLATAIYFEARGEPQRGQAAVAEVVINRTSVQGYPSSICGVVYQNAQKRNACQFSFACDGKPDRIAEPRAWRVARRIANDVLAGRRAVAEVTSATHYHASYVKPRWAKAMRRLASIGQHIFYEE
jgi:spore germination cell wall hydrolase CwlJ-like protein